MLRKGLYLRGNIQLPVAAVAIGAKHNLTIMFYKQVNRWQRDLGIKVCIRAQAVYYLQIMCFCVSLRKQDILFCNKCIVYQKYRLAIGVIWQICLQAAFSTSGQWWLAQP